MPPRESISSKIFRGAAKFKMPDFFIITVDFSIADVSNIYNTFSTKCILVGFNIILAMLSFLRVQVFVSFSYNSEVFF